MTSVLRAEEMNPPRRLTLGPGARFVTGRAVSDCGDWLSTVAVGVALWDLTGSVAAPALAILLRVTPRPFGSLAGGHLADRVGPVRALVALNAGRALVTGMLALALLGGAIPLALLLLVASQAAGAACEPAGQAAVPRLVPAAGVARLNAALGAVDSVALVIGPGLAGALLALSGRLGVAAPAWLVAGDSLSFVLLVVLLATLREPRPAPTPGDPASAQGPWRGVLPALRRSFTRQLALAQLGIFAATTALQGVLPAAAAQRFGSVDAVAWVYLAAGAGNAAGAATLLRTGRRGLSARLMAVLTALELIPLGLFAVISSPGADLALVALGGLASAPYEILAVTELARSTPNDRLGATSAAIWLFGYSGMLAGGLLTVVLAPRLGWSTTLMVVWLGGAVSLGAGWARRHSAVLLVSP